MAVDEQTELQVRPEHLESLDAIHALLKAMNDPYTSAAAVTELVRKVPVLSARLQRRARLRALRTHVESLEHALALLGNRGLESELLDLLEELTELKSSLAEP